MTSAAKENSVDAQNFSQQHSGKNAERKPSVNGPRVALAAKSVNTLEYVQSDQNSDRKRAASHGASFNSQGPEEAKRFKAYTSDEHDGDEESTDDDEEPTNTKMLRNSTPTSTSHANSRSRNRFLSRNSQQQDIVDECDFALPTDSSPIPDEDLLDGYEPRLPLFSPPRYIPNYIKAVEDSMDLDFHSLPELEISDIDSDDADVSYLGLRVPG